MSKLKRIRSVSCLIALIVSCISSPAPFSEILNVSGLKRSTLWDCLTKLNDDGMIELRKALTISGPRTMVYCTKSGLEALRELEVMLKSLVDVVEDEGEGD